jgi:hypothetical protein
MFDYVKCDVPLPDGANDGGVFTTKDFQDPYMETYTISKEGRLIHHKPRYTCDPPDQPVGDIDMNFHGYLRFHRWDNAANVMHFYRAKFTDGQLVDIEHKTK